MSAPFSDARDLPSDSSLLQGTVEAWDASAGTNTVRIRGKACTNILSAIGAEAGLLRAGDSVLLARVNNTYAVIARVEGNGVAARAFGVQSARADAEIDVNASTAGFVELTGGPSVEVVIGSTRRCRVELSGLVRAYEGLADFGFRVTGASTIAADYRKTLSVSGSSPTSTVRVEVTATRVVNLSAADGLVPGKNIFTAMYRFGQDSAGGAGTFGLREIAVQPY